MENDDQTKYPIGMVSRLTGIAAGTIRMWERRYNSTKPERGAKKGRLYSAGDIHQLRLLKSLVDSGRQPGQIASLNVKELEEEVKKIESLSSISFRQVEPKCEIVFVGESENSEVLANMTDSSEITLVGEYTDIDAWALDKKAAKHSTVVIETPALHPDVAKTIVESILNDRNCGFVLVFKIATRTSLNLLESSGVVCVRSPASKQQLFRACRDVANKKPKDTTESNLEAKYNPQQLKKIAEMSPTIKCECPHHLAELINSLNAFATYCRECAVMDEADAALHNHLENSTQKARSMMEDSLSRVLAAEKISV